MKNESNNNNVIVIDPASNSDGDDNSLPACLSNPLDKSYEKPEKLQNRIKLIELIKDKIDDDKLYICLDIEAYERNHDYLTEFGWCLFKKDGKIIKIKHAIVEEYKNYHNGRYVPDNKDHYNFGNSKIEKLKDIYKELKNDFDKVNYLVGHGINNDIRFLKKIKVDVSKFKKMNSGTKIDDYGIIETMDLFSGFFLTKPVGLEKSLRRLEIPYKRLHNAGNDAYYTMQVFLEIIKRFDFSSNRLYEQIMNYKPPKKIKSNNNKNNKVTNNSNNNNNNNNNAPGTPNSNGINSMNGSNETEQGKNDNTAISNVIDLEKPMNNNNTNSGHQVNGNNNKIYNKNNRSNNKDNEGGNNPKNIVKKNNSQRRNNRNHRNLNNKKSHNYMRSNGNGHNNNYNNNNNLKV